MRKLFKNSIVSTVSMCYKSNKNLKEYDVLQRDCTAQKRLNGDWKPPGYNDHNKNISVIISEQ